MDENELLEQSKLTTNDSSSRRSPYDVLMQQSRKMGTFATRTFDVTKEFLASDVSRLHPDALLFSQRAASRKELASFVQKSHEILASVKTFPLPQNIFPDSIILDRAKLTITTRSFFWNHQTISVRIEDILSVAASTGPFFGSIIVSIRVMNSTDHYEIDALWRRDAIYLKGIIEGYMIAHHNGLNTADMSKDELVETLLELGGDGTY